MKNRNKFYAEFDGIDTYVVKCKNEQLDYDIFIKSCDTAEEADDYITNIPDELYHFYFTNVGIEYDDRKYFWELVKGVFPELDIMQYEDNQIWHNATIIDYRGDYFYNIYEAVDKFIEEVKGYGNN